MRKLNAAVDRFAYNHPRFGIPNLMRIIVAGNVLVYLLAIFAGYGPISFLAFNWSAITQGELWRLVTFIFMPGYYSTGDVLWLALFLYFYYMIGTVLEREWGTPKFSLYYLSGVVLTVIVAILTALISGQNVMISGTGYVNLSMFFAFAMLYPETQFLVFFIIPVKVKWLAWIDAAFFALSVLSSLVRLDFAGALLPVVALLNFFVFFWTNISDEIAWRLSSGPQPVPDLPPDHPLQIRRPPAAEEGGGPGLPPQVRSLRPYGYGLSGSAVPVLFQVRRIPLLL